MELLIIGKIPPPIGGVTIHVKRLIDALQARSTSFSYIALNPSAIIQSLIFLWRKPVLAHLHSSSPILRLLFALVGTATRPSNTIVTYHGNLGRYGLIKNLADYLSIKLVDVPVVVNKESYRFAKKLNRRTHLISAFIPPTNEEPLPEDLNNRIQHLKLAHSFVFCTNAYSFAYDRSGREIYCGIELLKLFCRQENRRNALIFSDPSGTYKHQVHHLQLELSRNILLISESHSFWEILKKSDCFIRCTTTDGDPLSIREAISLGKVVFASNAVARPQGVYTFSWAEMDELQNLINQFGRIQSIHQPKLKMNNAAYDLIDLYKSFGAITGD